MSGEPGQSGNGQPSQQTMAQVDGQEDDQSYRNRVNACLHYLVKSDTTWTNASKERAQFRKLLRQSFTYHFRDAHGVGCSIHDGDGGYLRRALECVMGITVEVEDMNSHLLKVSSTAPTSSRGRKRDASHLEADDDATDCHELTLKGLCLTNAILAALDELYNATSTALSKREAVPLDGRSPEAVKSLFKAAFEGIFIAQGKLADNMAFLKDNILATQDAVRAEL